MFAFFVGRIIVSAFTESHEAAFLIETAGCLVSCSDFQLGYGTSVSAGHFEQVVEQPASLPSALPARVYTQVEDMRFLQRAGHNTIADNPAPFYAGAEKIWFAQAVCYELPGPWISVCGALYVHDIFQVGRHDRPESVVWLVCNVHPAWALRRFRSCQLLRFSRGERNR